MYAIDFNENDITNLVAFLGRAELKGSEAPVLMDLLGKLQQRQEIKQDAPKAAPEAVTPEVVMDGE